MTSGGFSTDCQATFDEWLEASHGAVTPAGLSDHPPEALANVGRV
jgi:hypothetical protein